jgi:hypothetical protein
MIERRARRYHASGGSSWKPRRVPAIQCCLSDSKYSSPVSKRRFIVTFKLFRA